MSRTGDPVMTRRELIRRGAVWGALAVTPSLDGVVRGRGSHPRAPWRSIAAKAIPSSGEVVPVIGLGTGSSFSRAAAESPEHPRLRSVLDTFLGLGGAVVDTAPNYGRAEPVLASLIAHLGARDEVFFATKVAGVRGREAGVAQARESAERSGTQPIDLLQVHNLVDWRTQLPLLLDLRSEGVTRYVGVTTYRDDQYAELETVLDTHEVDFVQIDYSIANRGAETRILRLAANRGIAVIANMPFGNGRLFGSVRGRGVPPWLSDYGAETWAQFFLRWIVSSPAVTVVVPATADPGHVEDNVLAGAEPLPSPAERDDMRARYEGWIDA